MGRRVNYFLVSDLDGEGSQIAAIFFSNNSHPSYEPEERFNELANDSLGITELATKLLNERYPSQDSSSTQRPFWLDSTAGDNEKVVLVYWENGEELAMKGFASATKPIIKELPALTAPTMDAVRKYL